MNKTAPLFIAFVAALLLTTPATTQAGWLETMGEALNSATEIMGERRKKTVRKRPPQEWPS